MRVRKNRSDIALVSMPYHLSPRDSERYPNSTLHALNTLLMSGNIDAQMIDLQELIVFERKFSLKSIPRLTRQIATHISSYRPKAILFISMCNSLPFAVSLARACKYKSDAKIVFGGTAPTLIGERFLKYFDFIDVLAIGEADETVLELVRALREGTSLEPIRGILFRKGKKVFSTKCRGLVSDLDKLPLLNLDKLDPRKYKQKGKITQPLWIDVGRGCPNSCSYCASSRYWTRKYRQKSPERIIREIKEIYCRYGFQNFKFNHDQFTLDEKRLLRFLSLMKKDKSLLRITWACYSRLDSLSSQSIKSLSKARCSGLFFGFESGSDRILKKYNKRLNLSKGIARMRECLASNLTIYAGFVVGHPDESSDDLNKTLRLAIMIRCAGAYFEMSMLEPFPGTEIYDQYKDRLSLPPREYLDSTSPLGPHEMKLINKYPDVFTNYYRLQSSFFSFKYLWHLIDDMLDLIYAFPFTLLHHERFIDQTPIELYDEVCKHAHQTRSATSFINDFISYYGSVAKKWPQLKIHFDREIKTYRKGAYARIGK